MIVKDIKRKLYSNSDNFFIETITVTAGDKNIKDVKGFVTCLYDGKWWVGCVLDAYDDDEFKITFLHTHGLHLHILCIQIFSQFPKPVFWHWWI